MTNPTSQTPRTTHAAETPRAHDAADDAVMSMLHEHIPLSLLCDLTSPEGPESAAILAEEGEPDDKWWEQP